MILIPLIPGSNPSVVFADLVDIVRCDPGLTVSQPTLFANQVDYTQKKGAVTSSTRILELVNSPVSVGVAGVATTFALEDGTTPVSDRAGLTRLREGADVGISIRYDITDKGGMHWTVKDKDWQDIYMPRQVILYHELAHAYHDIKGDLRAKAQREIQAIADENDFRSQLGLPLRNSTSDKGGTGMPAHGGVTFPNCSPEKKGWSPGWKCPLAVATEALGSPDAAEIAALRRARATYRSVGLWGALIAQPTLDLYGRFGPRIARAMRAQPPFRDAMLWFVVLPTCHLLQVAEAYLAADADTPTLTGTVHQALLDYVSALARTPWRACELRDAASDAMVAATMLRSAAIPALRPSPPEPPSHLFSDIARVILAVDGDPPAAFAWGFEGVAVFLRDAARLADDSDSAAEELVASLGTWVARLPLPASPHLRIADAQRELSVLASRILTRAETRAQFAEHLLAHWSQSSSADLQIVLRGLGFLSGARERGGHA